MSKDDTEPKPFSGTPEEAQKIRLALERAARKIEQISACDLYMKAFKKAAKIVRAEKPD